MSRPRLIHCKIAGACLPVVRSLPVILLVSSLVFVSQVAEATLSLGAGMNYTTWGASLGASQYQSDHGAPGFNVNIKVKFDKLFAGVDYASADYDFSGATVPGSATVSPDSSVRRNEYNVLFGYYIYRYFSVAAKYKKLIFDNGDSYRFEKPGIGARLHYPLSSHWLVFGNTAIFGGDFSINGNNAGNADITEYSLGVAYRPVLHSYISLNYRKQTLDYQYRAAATESHTLSGWFASYNYVF